MNYERERRIERKLVTGNRARSEDENRPADKRVEFLARMYEANPPFDLQRSARSANLTDQQKRQRSESAKRRYASRKGAA